LIAQAKSALTYCRIVLALSAFAGPVLAEDRQSETVPQVDAYFKLSDEFRLYTTASLTQSVSDSTSDGELGAYLDVLTLKPIILEALLDQLDLERNRYLWARVGFAFSGIHEGLRLSNGYSEKRLVIEATGRYPMSSEFWVVVRARTELRELHGDRSNRYRLRFGIEKAYTVFGMTTLPYGRVEFLYDTRFNALSRQIYQAGVEVRLTQSLRIEPYYAFQNDTRTSPAHLDRLGLVLKYYR
jgi:hypothetical protein